MPVKTELAPAMSSVDSTTGGEFVAPPARHTWTKDIEDCVSKKISFLAHEHPDWDNDQCVAVAYQHCGEAKKLLNKAPYRRMLLERQLKGHRPGNSYLLRDDADSPIAVDTDNAIDYSGINLSKMTVPVIVTTMARDNYGDIVNTQGMDCDSIYRRNPLVLYNHISFGIDGKPIGRAETDDGQSTITINEREIRGVTHFSQTLPLATEIFHLIVEKMLRGVSIGFDVDKDDETCVQQMFDSNVSPPRFMGLFYRKSKMLEYSHVVIPANSDCLVLMRSLLSKGKIDGRPLSNLIRRSIEAFLPPSIPLVNGASFGKGNHMANVATPVVAPPKADPKSLFNISMPAEMLDGNATVTVTRSGAPVKREDPPTKPKKKPGDEPPKPAGKAPAGKEEPPEDTIPNPPVTRTEEPAPQQDPDDPQADGPDEPEMLQGARTNMEVHRGFCAMKNLIADHLPRQDNEAQKKHLPYIMNGLDKLHSVHKTHTQKTYPDLNLDDEETDEPQEPEGEDRPPLEQKLGGARIRRFSVDAIVKARRTINFLGELLKSDRFNASERAAIEYHVRELTEAADMPEPEFSPENQAQALKLMERIAKGLEKNARMKAIGIGRRASV